jgi:hypothetical protein
MVVKVRLEFGSEGEARECCYTVFAPRNGTDKGRLER